MWGLVSGGIPHTYRIHTREGLTEAKRTFRPNNGQSRRISVGGTAVGFAVRQRRPGVGGNPGSSERIWGESLLLRPCLSNPDSDRRAELSRLAAGFTVEEGVVAENKAALVRDAKRAWDSG